MFFLNLIKKPIVTEKTISLITNKKYCFIVDLKSNKNIIKKIFELKFNINIKKINIINIKPKKKKKGKFIGYTGKFKKVIITLKKNSKKIEMFEFNNNKKKGN